jgi:phosphatidylglycerophosphate synthase
MSAIILAMLTDSIDGYLARRTLTTTRFGAILDPIMDKFFVIFALCLFFTEGKIEGWQALSMISRDFFLLVFAIYLAISGHWPEFECTAIRWGKITTTLQFFILLGLTAGFSFPWYLYSFFVLFGGLAFIELCQLIKHRAKI